MAWTCGNPTCGALVALDSEKACPVCHQEKQSWTLQAQKTRTLRVGPQKARLTCRRGEPLPAADGAGGGVAWRPTEEVSSVPKAVALGLAARGLLPDPRDLWQARMVPAPADATWALTLRIPCEARAQAEKVLEFERRPDDLDEAGAFAGQFLCVHGPEAADGLAFPGIHVLDVTDDTELGHAPRVEVKGFRVKAPIPLALVPRGSDLLECSRGASTSSAAGATAVAWRRTTAASVFEVDALSALRAERRLPEARDRLRVRLTPGDRPAWLLRLTPDGGAPTELEFARDPDGLDPEGGLSAEFAFARGSADGLDAPGLHVLDVGSARHVIVEAPPDVAAARIALEPQGAEPEEAWLVLVSSPEPVTSLRLSSDDGSYHEALDGSAAREVDGVLEFRLPPGAPGAHTARVETASGAWPDRRIWIGAEDEPPSEPAPEPAPASALADDQDQALAAPDGVAGGARDGAEDGDEVPADPSDFCGGEEPPPRGGLLHLTCGIEDEHEAPSLLVHRGDGALVGRVDPAQGRVEGRLVTYSLDPAQMPSPCRLMVADPDDEVGRPFGGTFAPERVRDALMAGAPRLAFALLLGEDAALAAGGGSGAHAVAGGARVGAPTSPTGALMTLRVSWKGSEKHRLVQFALRVELTTPAVQPFPDPQSEATDHCDLSIATGTTKVVLEVEVPKPAGSAATRPILKLVQAFDVDTSGPAPRLVPTGGSFKGGLDPRLTLGALAAGSSALVPLELDLSFLDVTEHVTTLPGNPTLRDWLSLRRRCKYRVLESTRPGLPATFLVVIPPKAEAEKGKAFAYLHLHFQHEMLAHWDAATQRQVGGAYTNSDDIDYGWRMLYFNYPPAGSEGSYLRPTGTGTGFAHWTYPPAGWDAQLADADRPVMLLFPYPQSTSYGQLERYSDANVKTLERLLRAMCGDGVLASPVPPWINRLAVSGWSSGTNTLWRWCTPGNTAVDEVYAFDGVSRIPPAGVDFSAWFFSKPDRRLRLLGTGYTQGWSIQFADAIEAEAARRKLPPGRATAMARPLEYWFDDGDYRRAWRGESIRKKGDPAPATPDASSATNVFLASVTKGGGAPGTTIEWQDPATGRWHQGFAPLAPCEVAGLLRHGHDPAAPPNWHLPVRAGVPLVPLTKDKFDKIVASFNKDPNEDKTDDEPFFWMRMRHAWSIAGGEWSYPGHVGTFMGNYRIALEESGFPT